MKNRPQYIAQLVLLLSAYLTAHAQPQFSQPHGLYTEPIRIELTTDNPAAIIHYTLDGSEPTATSSVYTTPFDISQTTILRAVEQIGDSLSPVATASYIFPQSVFNQSNSPIGYPATWGSYSQFSGTAPAYYEMFRGFDNYSQMLPYMEQGLRDLPILSIVTNRDYLFSHEINEQTGGIYIYTGAPVGNPVGRGWERPVSIELIGGPQQHDLTYPCGIVIHGGHGRLAEKNPKHSFRLKFKKEYGGKKTLHYPVFTKGNEAPEDSSSYTAKYDQLVLRCHFGNTWQHWDNAHRLIAQYTRDLWARMTQKRMGWTAVEGLYVNLFINGLYWGLYNIAERIDTQFCKDHEGGDKTLYDVIKVDEMNDSYLPQVIEAAEGNLDAWNEMVSVAETASRDEGYLRLQGLKADGSPDPDMEPLLHIDNFIDYMLINQYAGNNDWDNHNWYAFRQRGPESKGFQFLCWDTEQIFEGALDNRLNLNAAGYPTGIFQTLMKHPDFLHRYMDRAYAALSPGGQLSEQQVVAVWDSLYYTIANALYLESSRWGNYRREVHPWKRRGPLFSVDTYYLNERQRLLDTYFPTRSAWMLSELTKKHWMSQTEAPAFLLNGREVTTDTLTLTDMLTLTGPSYMVCTTDGHRPVTWVGSTEGIPSITAFTYEGNNLMSHLSANAEGTWVSFSAIGRSSDEWSPAVSRAFYIRRASTGIHSVDNGHLTMDNSVYDLQGRRVANSQLSTVNCQLLKKGVYIVNGKKVIK